MGVGGSGRQNAATRRNMRREERVTVQGPVKEQQPDGMSHRGGLPTPPTTTPTKIIRSLINQAAIGPRGDREGAPRPPSTTLRLSIIQT